jgi:hypothetical protein
LEFISVDGKIQIHVICCFTIISDFVLFRIKEEAKKNEESLPLKSLRNKDFQKKNILEKIFYFLFIGG